jgi:hypothetical protein
VQGIHADRMPGRLDLATLSGSLQHPELNLELRRVPTESFERFAHLLAVESVGRARQVLDPGQRRQRWGLRRTSLAFRCHPVLASWSFCPNQQYDCCIGSWTPR